MNYTNVFGGNTVPPSEYSFRNITLTEDVVLNWPDNYFGANVASAIMAVTATTTGLAISLPNGSEVSPGRDLLFRNAGSNIFTVKKSDGTVVTTLASGESKYLYVSSGDNWSVIPYGVGSSSVDAAALVGYGLKALDTTINQAHPITNIYTSYTVQLSDRAKLIVYSAGAATIFLPTVATVGNDFFFMLKNSGTGTLTIDPYGSEIIDGVSNLYINPGESLFLCSSGTAWFSVGYGRATEFNFTQLTKDVSSAGTFTLTASEAANKLLTFVGTPGVDYTVVVPPTVQVYYVHNNITSFGNVSVTVKTASGSGPEIQKGQRLILFCDGINVYSATSTDAYTTIIDVGDTGYTSARYAYTETGTGNDTVIVPYSGFISLEVYYNGSLQAEEYNDYTTVNSGDNTVVQFAQDLNLGDRVYFIMQYLAEFGDTSYLESHVFTATEGQTTFSWTSSTFINIDILLFVDGVKQVGTSYTLNGNEVILSEGVPVGTLVEVCLIQNTQNAVSMVEPILMMPREINTNTVIPTGYNAMSVDPEINAIVTVAAGSVWAIVGE